MTMSTFSSWSMAYIIKLHIPDSIATVLFRILVVSQSILLRRSYPGRNCVCGNSCINRRENIHLRTWGVNDTRKSREETGKTVLHLLGSKLRVAVLQVLALHQVGRPGHLAHHDGVGLHEVEGTFLDDGGLLSLAKSYGHLEGVRLWQVGD